MSYRIIDVPVPDSPTEQPGWEAVATAELSHAIDVEIWGHDDLAISAEQIVAGLTHQENTIKQRFLAVDESVGDPTPSDVLGIGAVWMPRHDNVTSANIDIGTRADARGRGVGAALWDHSLEVAREHDRSVLQGWSSFPVEPADGDPNALTAPTGSGRVPADDPATRFALARDCRLEQAERHSVLEVPVDSELLDRLGEDASQHAGSDYEIVSWSDRVPDEWIDEFCILQTRMSTDAPAAGLTYEEEVWTPERVRSLERAVADNGMGTIAVAALHRPSGELGGFTEIALEHRKPHTSFQENTIVRAEHRGHRLGMLLKVANLRRLAAEHPRVRRVHTWNAEENDFMLSINVALGFRPAGGGAAWELKLDR